MLSFQISHFGDETKPDTFFVDPEQALNYRPEFEHRANDDDGLGWYDDGVKRTLTDEQIKMFRHSEMEALLRARRLQNEEESEDQDQDDEDYEPTLNEGPGRPSTPGSPVSDASSLEPELRNSKAASQPKRPRGKRLSQKERSERYRTKGLQQSRQHQRREQIPYDERHKRKWEQYIDENDPAQGSMTHRRLVRELDSQQDQSVDLDY